MSASGRSTERRVVQSLDPSLSDRANEALTDELRRVCGADVVDVPVGEPSFERERHARRPALLVAIVDNRLWFSFLGAIAIVVGVVAAFVTSSWWWVGIAVAINVIGIGAVVGMIFSLSDEAEHLSPEVVALLEDEGVSDPDEVFRQLLAEFGSER
ncbi:MAG TPA: hypothetical protein VGM91_09420 [Conexibacter sp.]|jgi:hypothetical protein